MVAPLTSLLVIALALVGCISNGSGDDAGDDADPGDAASDVLYCTRVSRDSGLCPVTDSCGNEIGAAPDGANLVVDSCGGTCTCTVDSHGFATVQCSVSCACATPCMPP